MTLSLETYTPDADEIHIFKAAIAVATNLALIKTGDRNEAVETFLRANVRPDRIREITHAQLEEESWRLIRDTAPLFTIRTGHFVTWHAAACSWRAMAQTINVVRQTV